MNNNLFDDSDDDTSKGFQLKTNEDYAKSYNNLRKKELLQKFKDKGLNASESDESSDSDSSEEDEVLDPTFDQEFLKTLASLKSKNPTIYDKNTKFFENVNKDDDDSESEERVKSDKSKKKSKPVTLKDYERQIILEKDGKFVDDSDSDDSPKKNPFRPASPTVAEEERRLKDEFKKVMKDNDDSSDEEFGGIFKKREKSKAEKEKEEQDYIKWLAGKEEAIEEGAKETLKPLKNYWSSDKLPSSEKFLRDYILNKGYTEANNYAEIPTYEEIVGDNAPLSEDEEELEKQAEFEHKFNFRFEDPDQEFIKRYPRTVESSVRRTDDKRKQKRQELKERKQQEKEQKMKELEMVKEMKRKEIQEKIEKLKMVTGNDELGFKDDDLEEDFDPEAHDRRMRELFNDDYYQVDEGEEKPECPSDIDELKIEDWDNYDPRQDWNGDNEDYEPHCEDEDFNMDCDYDPSKAKEDFQKELIENTKSRRGRKGRRNRFMEMIKAEKPVFDPEDEKTYGEYIDEYYKLDCEDIIGDTPCRFKYVETTPNDFGLTIEEILLAKNKELNQWASLKKAIQIRPDQVEKKEQRLYKLKAKNEELKRKIFKSLYAEGSDNEDDEKPNEVEDKPDDKPDSSSNQNNDVVQTDSKKAKKKRKRKAKTNQITETGETQGTTADESIGNNTNSDEILAKKPKLDETLNKHIETKPESDNGTEEQKKKKKKNRKKKKNQAGENTNDTINGKTSNTEVKANEPQSKNQKSKDTNENKNQNPKETKEQNITPTAGTKPPLKSNPFGKGINGSQKSSSPTKHQAKTANVNNETSGKSTNKFKNSTAQAIGSLPPLRQNIPKTKPFNKKFKPKFSNNKKAFNGKTSEAGISDERLKAYGINPKKFHNKQKYGGANKQN